MTRKDDLDVLQAQAKEAKAAGKSAIAVPIDLLLAVTVRER